MSSSRQRLPVLPRQLLNSYSQVARWTSDCPQTHVWRPTEDYHPGTFPFPPAPLRAAAALQTARCAAGNPPPPPPSTNLMATQAVRSRNEGGTSCRGAPAAPAGRAGGRRRGLHLPPEPAEGPPTSRVCRTADCRMATSGVLSITGIITASTPHSITSKEHQQPRG